MDLEEQQMKYAPVENPRTGIVGSEAEGGVIGFGRPGTDDITTDGINEISCRVTRASDDVESMLRKY